MKIGIIFDFDGVLVDSLSFLKEVYFGVCGKVNSTTKSIDLESDFNILNGCTIEEISQYIHNNYAKHLDCMSILKLYREELTCKYNNISVDLKWVEIFERYKNRGVFLSIASGCDTEYINLVLTNNSIQNYFDLVVGGDQVKKGKPDPEVFLRCKEILALDDSLIIDDSNNGIKAAILANSKVIKYDSISNNNIGDLIDKALSFNFSYFGQIDSIELDITGEMSQDFSNEVNENWSRLSVYNGKAFFVDPIDLIDSDKISVIKGSYKNFRIGTDIPVLAVTGMIKSYDKRILFGRRSRHNYQNKYLLDLAPSGTLSIVNALHQVNEEWSEESSSSLVLEWESSISLILDHNSKVLDLLFLSTGNSFSTTSLHSSEIDSFKWIDMAEINANAISESANFMVTLLDRL